MLDMSMFAHVSLTSEGSIASFLDVSVSLGVSVSESRVVVQMCGLALCM